MFSLFFTAPTEPGRRPPRKQQARTPSRVQTVFTWALLATWAVLMSFAAVSILSPVWLEKWARFGVEAEAWAYKDYGDTAMRQGNHRLAIAQYRRALEIKPNHAGVMTNMGITYIRAGDVEGGVQILQNTLQLSLSRNRRGIIYYNLAEVYERQGRRDEAVECYEQAAAFGVPVDVVYRKLGAFHLEAGQLESARAAFEKTLAGQLDLARSYRHMLRQSVDVYEGKKKDLAVIEAELAAHTSAEDLPQYDFEIIRQLQQRDPEIAKTHNHLGYIYFRLGNIPESIRHFERSLEIWPDNIDAKTNLPKLRQILQNQPVEVPPP